MPRYAKRTDENHAPIRADFRARLGCSGIGFGVPDLLIIVNGRARWVEVKQPGEGLTDRERIFFGWFPGLCHIARTGDDVEMIVNMLREEKSYGD
jgi:hypothetical protein